MQLVTVQRKSPDPNPVGNVWEYTKNIVQARVPQNLDQLDRFVQEALKKIIMPEYCKKLHDLIPKRLKHGLEDLCR